MIVIQYTSLTVSFLFLLLLISWGIRRPNRRWLYALAGSAFLHTVIYYTVYLSAEDTAVWGIPWGAALRLHGIIILMLMTVYAAQLQKGLNNDK